MLKKFIYLLAISLLIPFSVHAAQKTGPRCSIYAPGLENGAAPELFDIEQSKALLLNGLRQRGFEVTDRNGADLYISWGFLHGGMALYRFYDLSKDGNENMSAEISIKLSPCRVGSYAGSHHFKDSVFTSETSHGGFFSSWDGEGSAQALRKAVKNFLRQVPSCDFLRQRVAARIHEANSSQAYMIWPRNGCHQKKSGYFPGN